MKPTKIKDPRRLVVADVDWNSRNPGESADRTDERSSESSWTARESPLLLLADRPARGMQTVSRMSTFQRGPQVVNGGVYDCQAGSDVMRDLPRERRPFDRYVSEETRLVAWLYTDYRLVVQDP